MNVSILTIGEEILIGQVIDTNSAWMGRTLNMHGARVVGIHSVGDDHDAIQRGLSLALAEAEVVLLTGGLGPTKDDITKKALAEFFGAPTIFHQPTYERIVRIFQRLGRPTSEAHWLQAFLPANALLLPNKMGTAPGMWFDWRGKIIVSMPGVPYEMQYLMEREVLPRLHQRYPGRPIAHRTLLTAGEGESTIATHIAAFEAALPPHIRLAYLPNLGQVRLRLSGSDDDAEALNALLDQKKEELRALIPELVYGYDDDQLEAALGRTLKARGLTIGTAESCTGGYVAHRITAIAGASDYFLGSIVAYDNAVKRQLLGVKAETLEQHGAVSRETVLEMVEGARRALGVDVALAISGIAGPGGGTPEKPVGTIWMAASDARRYAARKLQAGNDRLKNIEYAGVHALNFTRLFLTDML
jgi:nicotinamide-nucleotide amidase